VPESHLRRGDLVARRLASGPLRQPWGLVWRREVEEAALQLWRVLEKAPPRVTSLPHTRARRERVRA
jgi:LysR family transcriptional regulator for metE and metH